MRLVPCPKWSRLVTLGEALAHVAVNGIEDAPLVGAGVGLFIGEFPLTFQISM